MNIIYIAFSCNPYNGSEDQVGWSIPISVKKLNKDNNIFVITKDTGKSAIEKWKKDNQLTNFSFFYIHIEQSFLTRKGVWDFAEKRFHRECLSIIKKIKTQFRIDIVHQITPVNYRAIGKYWRICKNSQTKFVCGPIGAVGIVPKPFWKYCGLKNLILEWIMQIHYVFKTAFYRRNIIPKIDLPIFVNNESAKSLSLNKNPIILPEIGVFENQIKPFDERNFVDKVTILVAGRMVYRKGHLLLIEALEGLDSDLDYKLKIVGDGPFKKRIVKAIEKSTIKNKIELIGKVPYIEMNNIYREADVLAFTTFREATGTVIIEALSAGLPIITINKFGAPVMLNNDCAFLYDGKNLDEILESLRKCLFKVISDHELVRLKQKKAFEQASTLTHEKKANYLMTLYKSIRNNVD